MTFEAEAQYEFEERIAIRQIDGGCDLATADHLARVDLSHRPEEEAKFVLLQAGTEIERLMAERKRVTDLGTRETDPQRERELRERWAELSVKIAILKCKESDDDNDERVSG